MRDANEIKTLLAIADSHLKSVKEIMDLIAQCCQAKPGSASLSTTLPTAEGVSDDDFVPVGEPVDTTGAYIDPKTQQPIVPSSRVKPIKPLHPDVDKKLVETLTARGCRDIQTARVIITTTMQEGSSRTLAQLIDLYQADYADQFPAPQ